MNEKAATNTDIKKEGTFLHILQNWVASRGEELDHRPQRQWDLFHKNGNF